MPNITGQFGVPNQYTGEQQRIAELLRQAGMEDQLSLQPDQSQAQMIQSGPFSFYAPDSGAGLRALSKGLRGYSAKKMRDEAMGANKALGERYQSDLSSTMAKALAAGTGTPGVPNINPVDDNGTPMPGTAAVAPDRAKMAQILMGHPGTQAIGQQQLIGDMNRQALVAALGGGGQPTGTPGAAPPSGPGQPSTAVGGPAGGVPMAAWIQADPTGKAYMEQLAKDDAAKRTLTRFSPGGGLANQAGQVVVSAPFESGRATTYGPGGPTQGLVPGAVGTQTALGTTPLQEVKNSDQTTSYIPKAQLAAAAGQPTLGMRESPQQLASAGNKQLSMLQAEAQKQMQTTGQVDPALHTEIQNATLRASGQYPARTANPVMSNAGISAPKFGQTQEEQIRQQRETAGGKSSDEAVGKDLAAFMTGGAQDATRQIAQLGDTLKALQTPGSDLTGPVRGRLPDAVRSFTNPNAVAMRQRVEEVVQRSLRAILGAQFTEKEGERLISRAYDPAQPPEENAIRVQRLYTQLEQALQQKTDLANYFQKNGTMQGWQGKLPTMSDFDVSGASSAGTVGAPRQTAGVKFLGFE